MKQGFTDRGACLACKTGVAMDRTNRGTGEMFLGCSNYPKCKNSSPYPEEGVQPTVAKEGRSPYKKKKADGDIPLGLPYEARLAKKRFRSR